MKISTRVLHWLPRIICIMGILFISMFSIDALNSELTIWQQILSLSMHLIPSFVLILLLLLSWKRELIGGIIFMIIGLGFSPIIFIHNFKMNQSIWISLGVISVITIPFAIVGVLFIVSHYRKKKSIT
jgi:cell division protein FtsW (lipid II flippase)